MKTKVIRFYQNGGPEVLQLEEDEVISPPQDQELLLEQKAIGINYVETYYRSGLYPTPLPSKLGTEAAGVVLEVGKDVRHLKPGDRVAYAQGPLGSYSQFRTLPARYAVKIPEGIGFDEAAGGLLKGLTVQYLFRQTYPLHSGQTLLFHAAAGGVGLIACQWARHLGVRLIGTVSTEAKAALAKNEGAWETINYKTENTVRRVLELTQGQKVPVVYDSVGKATWQTSLDCLQERGLLVSFGNTSGAVTGVDLGILAQKGSLYLTRPTLATYLNTPEKLQNAARELFELMEKKIIQVHIGRRFPLTEARAAHEYMQSGASSGSTILLP